MIMSLCCKAKSSAFLECVYTGRRPYLRASLRVPVSVVREEIAALGGAHAETATKAYIKSSSISLTELYAGLVSSSSSSTSTFKKESYDRAAFSALRASASSRSAFFCKKKIGDLG